MTVTLQDAINAIQAGDLATGKSLLAKLLQQEPDNEAAWIWMSGTVEDIDQRRYCLEKALEINPANAVRRRPAWRAWDSSRPPPCLPRRLPAWITVSASPPRRAPASHLPRPCLDTRLHVARGGRVRRRISHRGRDFYRRHRRRNEQR